MIRHGGTRPAISSVKRRLILGTLLTGLVRPARRRTFRLLREKRRTVADRAQRRRADVVRVSAAPRAVQPISASRAVLRARVEELKPFFDRIVQITGDDEIAVHHRMGPGYAALYRRVLEDPLLLSRPKASPQARRSRSCFGPIGFTASEDTGSGARADLLLRPRDELEHPISEEKAYRQIAEDIVTTWTGRGRSRRPHQRVR